MRLVRSAIAIAVVLAGLAVVPARAADRPPRYVLFTGTYGFRHDGIQEEAAALQAMADRLGIELVSTGDPAVFSRATYADADGVILLQTTGLAGDASPLTPQQQADFIQFFDCGAGLVGIHAAADSGTSDGSGWTAYDDLLGSKGFDFHPHLSLEARENPLGPEAFNPAVLSDVTIQVEDQQHVTTLPWHGFDSFRLTDEIYKYRGDPRSDPDLHVVLSLDEESHYWRREIGAGPSAGGLAPSVDNPVPDPVNQVPPLAFPDDSPIAWVKQHGPNAGRVFYTNLGHSMATWQRADFLLHVEKGLQWAAGHRPSGKCLRERLAA